MDPQRKYRRVGPNPTGRNEDYDPSDLEDSSLERLDIGQSLDIFYTFTVETSGIVSRPDVRKLKVGNTYRIGVRKQKWWWMFEEDLPTGATTEEVREILSKQPVCEWKPDCVDDFEVVE